MLEMEIAALVHFIKPLRLKEYFGEVPEGAETPSIYYPIPEITGGEFSLSAYENSFSFYVKIFDKDDQSSYAIASKIVNLVQAKKKNIPLYDKSGNLTGKSFRIIKLEAKNIDVGTTQIMFTWNTFRDYDSEEYPSIENFHFVGLSTDIEKEEEETDDGIS